MTTSAGGEEHVYNPEPMGPTFKMVNSEKSGENPDVQDPHWTGKLLPPSHPRSEERVHEFWSDVTNVLR